MSRNFYELDDIPEYLTCDLKLSDTMFSDLFSEYDVNINDFQCFDDLTKEINSSQSTTDFSTSDNTILHPTATSNGAQSLQPVFDEALPPTVSYFPSNYIPTNHQESLSVNMSKNQPDQILLTKKQTINCSQTALPISVQLPKLNPKPESISVTFDEFKALIYAIRDTSKTNINIISSLLENSTIIGHNVPLKIVHHQDSPLTNENNYLSIIPNGIDGGTQRKSSQNMIEKRYRSSINEKINELKEIVAPSDGKIQKSGILRRTVEYIQQLQSTNQRLEEENTTLKTILKQFNLTNDDFPSNADVRSSRRSSSIKNTTSSSSTIGSDTSNEASRPVFKRQKRTKSKRGMVNGSRLVLCCFMLCVLIINPFDYLLDRIHSSANNGGTIEIQSIVSSRTLQVATENDNFNSLIFFSITWKQFIVWMLNIAICLVCLVKLLVYGEPIVHQSDMEEYYACKKKADQLMNENQLNDARIYYQKCCEKLYIPTSNTHLSYFCSITWQIIRLCLNLLFIGRWLIYWSSWTKSIDTRYYNLELNYCLLQLWKIEYHSSTSLLNLFNLFLSTINTSINSGKKLDRTKRNEIYFLSALTFKKFDGLFLIFIPYLLKYLKPIDTNDIWLLDTNRLNQLIFEKNIYLFKEKIFFESIRIQYFEAILYDNIRNQLLCQDEQQQIRIKNEFDVFSWWQYGLQVIRCISRDKQNINNVISTELFRQVKSSEQTIYHMARIKQIVDERYIMIIETIHNILIVLTDDNDQTNSTRIILLEQLGVLSRLFTSMIDICCNTNNENNLDVAIKTLLLDGILSLRLRLLTSSMTNNNQQIPYLDDFQRELDHYKQLNQLMKLPKQRLYLFESIFRISSGLHPLITQTLFERAIKQSNSIFPTKEESSLNLDIIAALLLFCHFSPSTVYRYRNMLQQAVTTSSETNKNKDLNRLQQQCLTLIRQSYFTL